MHLAKVVGFSILLPAIAFARSVPSSLPHLKTSLTVEKKQYFSGEPIMLTFSALYKGNKAEVYLSDSDAYGQCGSYHITVSPSAPKAVPDPSCPPQPEVVECLIGGIRLPAGVETKQHILLNRFDDFSHPGVYTVKVMRSLSPFGKQDKATLAFHGGLHAETSATFTFTVVAPQSLDDLKPSFDPFIRGFSSGSYKERDEAATVISKMAVPFLEPYLIQMVNTRGFQYQGIMGLRRLNTEKGRKAIFELLKTMADDDTLISWATQALIAMGDASYGQPLLDLARQTTFNRQFPFNKNKEALVAAARLDPAAAMPVVREQLASTDEDQRAAGTRALAATEQKEAIPMLVNLLSDPSSRVHAEAKQGLQSLTRITYFNPSTNASDDQKGEIPFWSAWLKSNPDLPIRLDRECWAPPQR